MTKSLRAALVAVVSALLVLAAVYAADSALDSARRMDERERVADALQGLQLQLQAEINGRLALLRDFDGLQSYPVGEPRSAALAAKLGGDELRYAWIAGSGVVDAVWPESIAERWLGRDLMRDPLRAPMISAAVQRDSTLLSLLPESSGELGLMEAYLPLYRGAAGFDDRQYWGVAVLTLSLRDLLRDAGLFSNYRDIEIGVRGRRGDSDSAQLLFGHLGTFYADALRAQVGAGGLSLEIAALPRQGWRITAFAGSPWWWRGIPLALCTGLLVWVTQRRGLPRPELAAGAAALSVALLSAALIWLVDDRASDAERRQLRRDVELAQSAIAERLIGDGERLGMLAQRRPPENMLKDEWSKGARRLLLTQPSLLGLFEWRSGEGMRQLLGEDSAELPDGSAAWRAERTGRTGFQLEGVGQSAPSNMVMWLPGDDSAMGLRYQLEELLNAALPPSVKRGYQAQIVNANGDILASLSAMAEVDRKLTQQTALAPLDYTVSLRLSRYRQSLLSSGEMFYLAISILLSVGLFWATWQMQRRQLILRGRLLSRSKRQRETNRALRIDIERRHKAERALRESESRYRVVFEDSNDAIMVVDACGGRITDANQAACDLLEYDCATLLATPLEKIHPGEFDALQRFVKDIHAPDAPKRADVTCITRSGEEVPVELSMAPIERDGCECLLLVARDQRERLAREEELRNAMSEIAGLKERVEAENLYLRQEIIDERHFGDIICQSRVMLDLLHEIEQVATSDATVLLLGESGTGKEVLARAVHNASNRAERALVKVNCAALPENLIESELFGHEKGAFSGAVARKLGRFELADGGTLFLDEIGELPLELQPKLLRALQEGEFERLGGTSTIKVDVRIIAATNRDLAQMAAEGRFREDLYYRLNVFPLHTPPLRDRREDIPLLVEHFAARYGARAGRSIEKIPQPVMARLKAYDWPGNVRELENVIERAVVLGRDEVLRVDEQFGSPPPQSTVSVGGSTGASAATTRNEPKTLNQVEADMIFEALRATRGVVEGDRGAAKRLGLAPSTLRERMKKYAISRKDVV